MTDAQRVSDPMLERNLASASATDRVLHGQVKISVTLSNQQYAMLQKLAADQDIGTADALRKAIVTEDFIKAQIKAGKKILIQDRDNTMQQVVFR
ncbi:MAG: hypothetical protein HC935_01710 [Pseudanabaena sp. SU_2_4]|nr:hypothetical protein [Pseudanabaena sp. SU_2_4]NKB18577.1 hypothetical protein [Pseudanabaena sp. CRU_2_10]